MDPVEIDTSKRIRLRVLIALVVCVGALTYVWYLFGSYLSPTVKRNKVTPVQNTIPSQPNSTSLSKVGLPKVNFRNYEVKAPSPQVPTQSKILTFKTNYTLDEAKTFASKFGLASEKRSTENPDYVIYTNTDDPEKRGVMTFNLKTGSFTFQSLGEIRPSLNVGSQAPLLAASIFVKDIGLDDGTITCANTYERKDIADAIFVKCNRDPAKVGGQIYGYPGILSVSEDIPFQSLKTGSVDPQAPTNDQIINTSDGTNGKIQPEEYNTITVALSKKTGRILSVKSTLRQTVSQEKATSTDLISPQDALDKIKKGGAEQSLVIPAGQGVPSWQNVFANNEAIGRQATVTDYVIAYLEKPGFVAQEKLAPYYIFRGLSKLETGYTARFVQVVPATKKAISFLSNPTVAGVSTIAQTTDRYQYGSQKQGSFELTGTEQPTQAPTNEPQLPSPTSPPTGPQLECRAPDSWMNVTLQVPGVGEMKLGRTSGHMFLFMSANFPVTTISQAVQVFDSLVAQQYSINLARWYQSNPALFNTASLDSTSLTTAYMSINKTIRSAPLAYDKDGKLGYQMPNNLPNELYYAEAPENPAVPDDRRKKVYEQVDQSFVQSVKSNQISALATQNNIFPDTVLNGFYFVLSGTGTDTPWADGTCYLSGSTPSIFTYSDTPTQVSIQTKAPFTYTYPTLDMHNSWNITANNSSDYLYYEYDRASVSLTPQHKGYVIQTNEWQDWLHNSLSPSLQLNTAEEKQFANEIRHALTQLASSPYIKISLADIDEVNKKLPLNFSVAPHTLRRIHLIMETRNRKENIVAPQIEPIQRHGLTVVEIGTTVK
jgi:hypothetical protein